MVSPGCAPPEFSSIASNRRSPSSQIWPAPVRSIRAGARRFCTRRYQSVNHIETIPWANFAQWRRAPNSQGLVRCRVWLDFYEARGGAADGHGRRHGGDDRLFRLPHHARHHAAADDAVHRPVLRRLLRHHQGPRAPGHPLRDAQRRRHPDGAEGQGHAAADEARRIRAAEGRRRRLRDLRQVRRARRHQLRPEHQPPARARRRARPHHPRHRPRPVRPRAPGAARTAAVLARNAGAVGLDRAARARRARAGAGPRHPPSRGLRRQRAEAAARFDRR